MVKQVLKPAWYERDPAALARLRSDLQAHFPSLHAVQEERTVVVQGSFAITHGGAELDWYQIRMPLPDDYPASPSTVFEMGGRIPCERDRHINGDGTLCLAVREELWLKWAGKFDVVNFLQGPVRTFLIANSLVEEGKPWPHGERSHDANGICEFYAEAVGFSGLRQIHTLLEYLVKDRLKGHWPCPCESGRELHRCHKTPVYALHAKVPSPVFKRSLEIVSMAYIGRDVA